MSKSIKLYLGGLELARVWNRRLKEFIRKGGKAKDFIKRFGNGPSLTPKNRIKELVSQQPIAPKPTEQFIAPMVMTAHKSPQASKAGSAQINAAIQEERQRCKLIMRHGQEHGCVHQAYAFAFNSHMSADKAIEAMQNISALDRMNGGGSRRY